MSDGRITASCTCGWTMDCDTPEDVEMWRGFMEILQPGLIAEGDDSEHVISLLSARHELARGKRHHVTLTQEVYVDIPSPETQEEAT